jgi:hypothetical protein
MGHFNTRVLRLVLVDGLVWSCDENLIRIWDPLTVCLLLTTTHARTNGTRELTLRRVQFKQVCELTEHSGMVRSILPVYSWYILFIPLHLPAFGLAAMQRM